MPLSKDDQKVNKAQALYNSGSKKYLDMIEQIDNEIPEICDILLGVAMGRKEPKYQVDNKQLAQLEKQLSTWKAFVHNPEKILSSIQNELKKKYSSQKDISEENSSQKKPAFAVFSPKAQN